ncbi:plasmid mobilization protein [Saccharicrinis sp. GN24d3]|uniref:plasmid mobilization protein n=1 Tax=Saccharicrinis sp. GN24d3 TaxID=3458416 RepID=UPI0040367FBB
MRPKKENKSKHTAQINVWMTQEDRTKIMEHYKKERFSTFSEFVRFHLLKKREVKIIQIDKDFKTIFKSLDYELAKLGSNMNQIAHQLNAYNTYMLGETDKIRLEESYELLKLCRKALEKHLKLLNL